MGTINKITIEQVETALNDNAYDIKAYWIVEQSPQPSTNEFVVTIECDEQAVLTQKTTDQIIQLSSVKLDPNHRYLLRVSSGNCKDTTLILLHTYEDPCVDYDGSTLKLSWHSPDSSIGKGRCLVCVNNKTIFDYEIPIGVCGIDIPFSELVYGYDPILSISLESYSDNISRGPVVDLPELCLARFVITNTDGYTKINFRSTSPKQTELSIPLKGDIYRVDNQGNPLIALDTPVTCGPLTLDIKEHTLKVNTTQRLTLQDYDSFISQLWQVITVQALYALLDIIPRCAAHNAGDTLYFHCGLKGAPPTSDTQQEQNILKEQSEQTNQEPIPTLAVNANYRCADIRPGFTLRIEQSFYMPQYDASWSDAAGFISVHTTDYPILLSGKVGSEYLSFDSFISEMEENTVAISSSPEALSAAAGVIDLSAVRMRTAFLRIQYPNVMYTSDVLPDIHESNNPVLIADPSWNYAEQHAYILLRGRTALTLMLTIMVNGKERKVAVGTTFGGLLQSLGIWDGAKHKMRWFRRDISGSLAQIVGSNELLQNMPLMNGDQIEG